MTLFMMRHTKNDGLARESLCRFFATYKERLKLAWTRMSTQRKSSRAEEEPLYSSNALGFFQLP